MDVGECSGDESRRDPPFISEWHDLANTNFLLQSQRSTMADWHTEMEKELIKTFGGTPKESFGPDGTIRGDPVEVRLAKKESRFRVNRDTHQELLANDGSYIFDDVNDSQPPRQVEADTVDDMLGSGNWFSDRGYEHRFLAVDDIF